MGKGKQPWSKETTTRERRLSALSDKITESVQAAMGHSPCPSCGDVGPHSDNGMPGDDHLATADTVRMLYARGFLRREGLPGTGSTRLHRNRLPVH